MSRSKPAWANTLLVLLLVGAPACGTNNSDGTNNMTTANNTSGNNTNANNTTPNNGEPCSLAEADTLEVCDPEAPSAICDCAASVVGELEDTSCRIERVCGELIGVDCGSAADGPYDYYDAEGQVVAECGGACFTPDPTACQDCPPPGWSCETF